MKVIYISGYDPQVTRNILFSFDISVLEKIIVYIKS